MRVFQRFATVTVCVVVAAAAIAVGSAPRPTGAQPAAAATPPPCFPVTRGRVITDPPLWVPTDANNHTITLLVRQTGKAEFCYVQAGQTSYYEAPTIQVHQGETFRLILKNELPVTAATSMSGMAPRPAPTAADGCNQLGTEPIPPDNSTGVLWTTPPPDPRLQAEMEMDNTGDTNIHTHGWDVSPSVDNVFKSTTASRSAAGPRSCIYLFAVPPSQSAGTYWYHAHMHGVSNLQVGGGLAGSLIVLPRVGPPPPSRVLIVKNLTTPPSTAPLPLFRQAGRASRALLAASAGGAPVSSPTFPPPKVPGTVWSGISFDPAKGPCGWGPGPSPAPKPPSNPLMVNGISIPPPGSSTPPATLQIVNSQRLRVINASANSYVYLFMRVGAAGTEDLQVVARDGVDLDTKPGEALPLPFKQLLLGPGNRVDILVAPGVAPRTLMSRYTCTGALGLSDPTQAIAAIPVLHGLRRTLAAPTRELAPSQTKAAAFVAQFLPQVLRHRTLVFTQYDNFAHFYVTDTSQARYAERPFWLQVSARPNDPDHYMLPNITVTQDDTEIWTLVNAAAEIHAFHIHQMTFKVLQTDDPELASQFKEVLLDVVPLAPAKPAIPTVVFTDPKTGLPYPAIVPTRTQILIRFAVVHPGTFVYHCHMLAHEDSGMMGIITVLPRRTAMR